jgi:hypothetical protein
MLCPDGEPGEVDAGTIQTTGGDQDLAHNVNDMDR